MVKWDKFVIYFLGPGTIGAEFKSKGYPVISNDIQYYSFVFNQYLIECNSQNTTFANLKVVLGLETIDEIFSYLNKLNGKEGFIYSNYCPSGLNNQEHNRTYFTDINGLKCDKSTIKLNHGSKIVVLINMNIIIFFLVYLNLLIRWQILPQYIRLILRILKNLLYKP